ncbi:hypothetical protein [Streptomyces purpurogeneiscleroticus]|uniref:hypothetical protein n=1 Tax=Streptomyces purpurogeneiscleroticus TaxID=68259 RepID=UPI001CBCE8B8|nr:hypothetical protein [Streptomyces purpurogeneiscleroticus]MBZ4017757.1 hypothetical protein [Streptomyces purpurogeneiscleroticus]
MRTRNLIVGVLSVVSLLAGSLTTAGPAHADALDTVTCTAPSSSQINTFDPPLTRTPASTTATVSTQYGPCVSTVPGVTSGSRKARFNRRMSCQQLLDRETAKFTITWDNGQTSTVKGKRVANVAGALFTLTLTGTVTEGLFKGQAVLQQNVAPSVDITKCTLGAGSVSSLYSAVTLEILPSGR